MASHTSPTQAHPHAKTWILISYSIVALTALLLRVLHLGTFLTHDEVEFWFSRSESLLRALRYGQWDGVAISTHPGVTTMWLGAAGIALREILFERGILQYETITAIVALHRLPTALVHVVGIVVGYKMLRFILPATTAFLAAMLWATDPFIVGYSRLLHVDALAGTFATLSLLSAYLAWRDTSTDTPWRSWRLGSSLSWLALSGICAGLSILSKSPAVALFPAISMLAMADKRLVHAARYAFMSRSLSFWHIVSKFLPILSFKPWRSWRLGGSIPTCVSARHGERGRLFDKTTRNALLSRLLPMCAWGVICIVTIIVVWPALWGNPSKVYHALRSGVTVEGAQPHMTGNFFLGQRNPAPGPLFYPVALVLRTTPWALLGLLLLFFHVIDTSRKDAKTQSQSHEHALQCRTSAFDMPFIAMLASFIIVFVVGLTLFPKKFNRYIVPVFPAVNILAAIGLTWHRGKQNLAPAIEGAKRIVLPHSATALISIVALINAVWWHPYAITSFNQVFGGAQAGARTFAVGWGEGLDHVAAWLNQQSNITDVLTISHMITSLQPYMRQGARVTFPNEGTLKDGSGYVVVYIYQVQGGPPPPPFNQFYGDATPLHTVSLHGVDYAWIYAAPPPITHKLTAHVGSRIRLRGFDQSTHVERGQSLRLKLLWETLAPLQDDYWFFAHVIDAQGQRYAQIDQPYATSTWEPGRFVPTEALIPLPEDMPSGRYDIVVGLYQRATWERLPITMHDAGTGTDKDKDAILTGPGTLLLTHVDM